MGIPQATVNRMQQEGITSVDDLIDFDDKSIKQLAENMRKPGGHVPDPAGGGGMIPTPPFPFGIRSQKRLIVACELVRYYDTVGRELTVANIRWTHVMKNFEVQWKALKDHKDIGDVPDVPVITKQLPIMHWSEAFSDFLSRVIGV